MHAFVDATAMCQAAGKEWSAYYRQAKTKQFIKNLAKRLSVAPSQLVRTDIKGLNTERGTKIHPELTEHFSMWLKQEGNICSEAKIRDALCRRLDGKSEVANEYGRVDVLTSDEVIEVKYVKQLPHAVGQVLAYSLEYLDRKRRVHLFGSSKDFSEKFLVRANKVCSSFDISLTYEIID